MLATWVCKIDYEIVDFVPLCEILMDQSCQKVLLVMAELGIQTFSSTTLPVTFLSIKVPISIALYLKQTVRFTISKPDIYIGIGILRIKVILFQTYLEIPTRPWRKLQLWIPVSGSELTLSYYYKTFR